MISVVIPVSNIPEATDECIKHLVDNAWGELDIIIIDNASFVPYENEHARTIYNTENKGFWPSMLEGIMAAQSNTVVCMHNDVFLFDVAWDVRIQSHFQADDKLAIAGLFGARGVAINGGRIHPEGNMLGRKYGTNQNLHGHVQTGNHPSVVFDSLFMAFDREKLYTIDYETIPMFHWTDRVVTLRLLKAGFHALTIGIGFDHGGSWTSVKSLNTLAEDWCKANNLPMEENWNMTVYKYGERMFREEFLEFTNGATELLVDEKFQLYAR